MKFGNETIWYRVCQISGRYFWITYFWKDSTCVLVEVDQEGQKAMAIWIVSM